MYRELLITLALAVITIATLVVAGNRGWQGTADMCVDGDQCFCERDRGGLIRTPANTLSNFGFVAAGLGIALYPRIEDRSRR